MGKVTLVLLRLIRVCVDFLSVCILKRIPSDWLLYVDVSFPTTVCSHDKLAICVVFCGFLAFRPQTCK